MPKVRMEDLVEGGFVNDQSGQATERVRKQYLGSQSTSSENKLIHKSTRNMILRPGEQKPIRPIPPAGKPKIRPLGNPTLKKFR